MRQARALRGVLEPLTAQQVGAFHRTFVRMSRALATQQVAEAADATCLPSVGLGDDLFSDFRSWLIGQGEDAYAAVLADPDALADLPGVRRGCGMGQPFGAAAYVEYAEKAGRSAARRLPALETIGVR
ncbi:DUF4240 domain-containing protein [Nocardioides sp. GY 10127]|uniref:DUF4240 domain-containing protein n=1 Tax=Nocardioides sp. GY 10127 TaxID=2569762 RepID=UPI001458E727|nr:DUF4240 domain-containing protein [Nocardioides sp. GY 10127]